MLEKIKTYYQNNKKIVIGIVLGVVAIATTIVIIVKSRGKSSKGVKTVKKR